MSKSNTIKEIAKKIANNGDANDYRHIPIGADSDNIDRPDGSTVEESLSQKVEIISVTELPTENIKEYPIIYSLVNEDNSFGILYEHKDNNWIQYGSSNNAQADVKIATIDYVGVVKPDGKTITIDEDGTIVGGSPDFTGTKEEYEIALAAGEIKDGTIVNITDDYEEANIEIDNALSNESENAVQNKVVTTTLNEITTELNQIDTTLNETTATLNDLNTTVESKADNIYYDEENSELQLKSGDTILSTVTIAGGNSSSGVKLAAPTNINIVNTDESFTIAWTDPEDIIDSTTSIPVATWDGTVVVRKVGSAPTSVNDGTIVIDSKSRNLYEIEGFSDTGLTNGVTYYYGIFPYTSDKLYTTTAVKKITPSIIYPSKATNISATGGNKRITITFSLPKDATSAKIVYGTKEPTSPTDGTVIETTTSPYTIKELTNDLTYYFVIYTYNEKGRCTASDVFSTAPEGLEIVTFADGTDEQIQKMLEAHYDGDINISDYWAVGDMRTISLSAMEATGVGESHVAQDQKFVIIGIEHDDLVTPINDKTKAAITVQSYRLLCDVNNDYRIEWGYMNSSNTNLGGWKGCARRTWCNNVFFDALPSSISSIVKTVKKEIYKNYNETETITTDDDVFLLSEMEIKGSKYYSVGEEGKQYEYFTVSESYFLKYSGDVTKYFTDGDVWWTRSVYNEDVINFVAFCGSYSQSKYFNASYVLGIAPAFCM